jgi:hypothetical protein
MQRIAAILAIGGGLILISWVTSPSARPATSDPRMTASDVDRADQTSRAVAPLTSDIDTQAARLRARVIPPPPKPAPDRNPFRFGKGTVPFSTEKPAKGTYPETPKPVEKGTVPVAPAIALPSLVAITSDARDGGLFRTAVLSMNDEMKIVRPGQSFDRFIVEAIGPDSVRIVDITSVSRATFTIAIR